MRRAPLVRTAASAAFALVAGCFSPSYQSGRTPCGDGANQCPEGFHCAVDRTCWRDGTDPSPLTMDLAMGGARDLSAAPGPDLSVAMDAGVPDLQSLDLAGQGDLSGATDGGGAPPDLLLVPRALRAVTATAGGGVGAKVAGSRSVTLSVGQPLVGRAVSGQRTLQLGILGATRAQ